VVEAIIDFSNYFLIIETLEGDLGYLEKPIKLLKLKNSTLKYIISL
jgi:hypothetical protein